MLVGGITTLRNRLRVGIVATLVVVLSSTVGLPSGAFASEDVADPLPAQPTVRPLADSESAPRALVPGDAVANSEAVITAFAPGLTRLAGSDRYETAIRTSAPFERGVPAVIVATGRNFPDALSAAAAAALVGAPLLLTEPQALSSAVHAEIMRLSPGQIIISGGPGVVSESVAQSLRSIAPVTRLAGSDRYETGLAVVEAIFPTAQHAIIATGSSFPDALAATGAAGARRSPVILVDGSRDALDTRTMNALSRLGVTDVTIAGADGVVSRGIESQLRSHYTTTRFGGSD